ncbi:hypothetical protein ACIO02_37635 [Streptomyces sp. NPDC087568]|uniref:hypothetical protein n=1 Tax=Streptomyces sp. NPDC087568 TaxID=3365799 RepID=UPI00382D4C1C
MSIELFKRLSEALAEEFGPTTYDDMWKPVPASAKRAEIWHRIAGDASVFPVSA